MLRKSMSSDQLHELTHHSAILEPKVFLNDYGFEVKTVRVLGPKGLVLWECADPELILGSSIKEVDMTVEVHGHQAAVSVVYTRILRPGVPHRV